MQRKLYTYFDVRLSLYEKSTSIVRAYFVFFYLYFNMSNKAFPYRPLKSERDIRFLVLEPGLADVRIMIFLSHTIWCFLAC